MGNNHSAISKPDSPPANAGSEPPSTTTSGHASPVHFRKESSISAAGSGSGTTTASSSKERCWNERQHIIPASTTHRSVAPPEPSLAQAQGSTIVNRPKSAHSGSTVLPHSSDSTPTARPAQDLPPTSSSQHQSRQLEQTKPVDVPADAAAVSQSSHIPLSESHLISHNSLTDMYLTKPPRLPLPIEEEVHTPGSPILAPDDGEGLPDATFNESSDQLTRKGSGLSAGTVDDEDGELRVDRNRPVVPTRLEWLRGGDKIYVTGTIFQWNRKQRLHHVEGKPGCFATTVHVTPGTYHICFLVDGIMQTSPDLPTTVDFGNNLVNYIEVNPDDVPKGKGSHPSSKSDAASGGPSRTSSAVKDQPKAPKSKHVSPPDAFHSLIPQYLIDFDQAEESQDYQNAVAAIEKLPTPPSLPGFLGKPILNAATLLKDDNSVLNMPNHTVLNHLATSSIKNNILAVSATTRYRNKYVTTIMYKPTSSSEG